MTTASTEWILIAIGAITASMLLQFFAPAAMLRRAYGQAPSDALSLMIARHWGLLVFLVGILLIVAAYQPAIRVPVIVVAIVGKLVLAGLILGSSLRQWPAAVVIAVSDIVMAVLLGLVLLAR
jgi:hypothetical protein